MKIPTVTNMGESRPTGSPPAGASPPSGLVLAAAIVLLVAAVALGALVVVTILNPPAAQPGQATAEPGQMPSISVSPAQGPYGTLLTVVGRNWPAGESVSVLIAPALGDVGVAGTPYSAATAGQDGAWSATCRFPSDGGWAEGSNVRIVALGSPSAKMATADFLVLPRTTTPTPTPGAGSPTQTAAVQTIVPATQPATQPATRPATRPPATLTATRLPTASATQPAPPTATPTVATPTPIPSPTRTPILTFNWWKGEYFANPFLDGTPAFLRDDATLSFNWGTDAPAPGLPGDNFSARWTRNMYFENGTYRFALSMDDGARLWIDGQLIVDEWRAGSLRTVFRDVPLPSGYHAIQVDYFELTGLAAVSLVWEPAPAYQAWKGEYFANPDLSGLPVITRDDTSVDFDWGQGAPAPGLPADQFSVRWTRTLFLEEGAYVFRTLQDDGMRVWIDNILVIDHWRDGSLSEDVGYRYPLSGTHALRVEYFERAGVAVARFRWERQLDFPTWKGEYYPNLNLSGTPAFVRNDAAVDFEWTNAAPGLGMPATEFSVRWTRTLNFAGGLTRFIVGADDGVRLWLDNQIVVDRWRDQVYQESVVERNVSAGTHTVRVEYYQRTGDAGIVARWEMPSQTATPTRTVAPTFTATSTRPPTATGTLPPTSTATALIPPTATSTRPPTRTATLTRAATATTTVRRPTATRTRVPPTSPPLPTLTSEPAGGRRLTLEPPAAEAGDSISVLGQRARPQATIKLGFAEPGQNPSTIVWLIEVTANEAGAFTGRLTTDSARQSADGLLVAAYDQASGDRWYAWLAWGRPLPFASVDESAAGAPSSPQSYARVFTSQEEYDSYHAAPAAAAPTLGSLARRLLRIIEPDLAATSALVRIDWTHYVLAEVYLGRMRERMDVEITAVARTTDNVQVVFRVSQPLRIVGSGATLADYPIAGALISRSDLGRGALPVVFITTSGQRLRPVIVTP